MSQLYMVVERFKDAAAVYARFGEQGRLLPPGVEYIQSWVDEQRTVCFQVMRADRLELLEAWMRAWDDLVVFEVWPVTGSAEAAQKM
ncbi:MAG: DUF3303 family protein [Phycisphaeraceae bacterium]|nr:DUF3303 family protein [Phycisphaeraceae bacterium]MCW5763282.1 DUF3303 family protein [Phycisphaeraceae bacterium]